MPDRPGMLNGGVVLSVSGEEEAALTTSAGKQMTAPRPESRLFLLLSSYCSTVLVHRDSID
jgi:hypothetical protein